MTAAPAFTRPFDALDLQVVEAMVLAALGPDGGLAVQRDTDGVTVTLTPQAARAVAESSAAFDPAGAENWVELIEPALVEAVVDRVGHAWRAEAEIVVGLALTVRADDAECFAAAAARGPVRVPAGADPADMIAADATSPELVALVY